jgi:DNA-directed RNA polymerase subunit RPC12/RpoP
VNHQLSLRWGPLEVIATLMAVVVAVLGLVFAGGTVMAGWLLFRQSREFREQTEQSIREHRAVLAAIVESWRRETDAAFVAKMAEYDQSIVDQQAKLDALTDASAGQRAELERHIAHLKRERDAASAIELEKLGAAGAAGPALGGRRSQQLSAVPALGMTGAFASAARRPGGYVAPEHRHCTSCGQEFLVPESPGGTMELTTSGSREVYCSHCGARNLV